MVLAYGMTVVASIVLICLCIAVDKKRDIWLLLSASAISVCNIGYFMLSVSPDLDAALTSNRLAYLGSVCLPLFMLMLILRFCGITRSRRLIGILSALAFIMLTITCTPGIFPWYYSSVDIQFADGSTRLIREYGPLHTLYYIYLFGYMLTMLCAAVYAIAKKRIRTKLHICCLLCAVLCNIIIWLVEQKLPNNFEWLSVSYILTELFVLVLYRSVNKNELIKERANKANYHINVLLTLFMLLFANFIRIVTKTTTPTLYVVSHIAVVMIYLSLLIGWGVSIHDRIVSKPICQYLIVIVGLMIMWILTRTLRHTVFLFVYPVGIWCWYAYYIPMLLIPLYCLFAAMHLGKPDNYKLPKRTLLLYIPSVIFIVLVLTNDLHELAFRFTEGYTDGWKNYEHGVVYYAATSWMFICIAVMMHHFIKHCRIPGTGRVFIMPIGLMAIGVLYALLYALDSKLFGFIEMTAALCFIVVSIWESGITTGIVQSNSKYESLLKASNMGVIIVDNEARVHYSSDDALSVSPEMIRHALESPVLTEEGLRISTAPIRGGHVLWQEDVSELMAALERLEDNRSALEDANMLIMRNYQIEKEIRSLAEKNRLHDELHSQTALYINKLSKWLTAFGETQDPAEKKELLRRLVVGGAHLKRRNNLILINEQDGVIPEEEFRLSVEEMMRNLSLAGISSGCSVSFGHDITTDAAMKLFDFGGLVVTTVFRGLEAVVTRFYSRGEDYYASLDLVGSLDLSSLAGENVSVNCDEDCCTVTLCVKGGGGI